jgi:hypothetical protein
VREKGEEEEEESFLRLGNLSHLEERLMKKRLPT